MLNKSFYLEVITTLLHVAMPKSSGQYPGFSIIAYKRAKEVNLSLSCNLPSVKSLNFANPPPWPESKHITLLCLACSSLDILADADVSTFDALWGHWHQQMYENIKNFICVGNNVQKWVNDHRNREMMNL